MLCVGVMMASGLYPQTTEPAQPPKAKPAKPKPAKPKRQRQGFSLEFDRYPRLRFGNALRVDLRGRMQTDLRHFDPEQETDEGTVAVRRLRFSVEGQFLRDFEYEASFALKEQRNIRDLYVNFRRFRDTQIQVGHFKIPFGLDQLTSPFRIDFVNRSRIGDQIAPARDQGIMLHGDILKGGFAYQLGLFRGGGENAREQVAINSGERTVAARLRVTPLRPFRLPKVFDDLQLFGAFTLGSAPAGRYAPRGRSTTQFTIFERFYAKGVRHRLGTELDWLTGPFSIRGEFMHHQVQRKQQSLFETDLPDLIARGWYLSGSWILTGEKKMDRIEPRREFLTGGGFGAIELATRYEQIRFGSAEHPGAPLRNPRAANIRSQSERIWTHGLNWYLNRWSRIQPNYIHEVIEDPTNAPVPGVAKYRSFVIRLQLTM